MELDDGDGSPFPAQCTFDIVEEFAPVPEAEFRCARRAPVRAGP